MKRRRRRSSQEGGGNGNGRGKGNEGGNNNSSNNRGSNNKKGTKKKKKKNPLLHPQPPVLGTVATRTRRQTNAIASTWNHPRPLIIKILSYADPEMIRMLCCVSKQFYDIIAYDPGMEHNRAIPLLQISPCAKEEDKGRLRRLLHFSIIIVLNYSFTVQSRSSMRTNLLLMFHILSGWNGRRSQVHFDYMVSCH